jgi:hypothetical protein
MALVKVGTFNLDNPFSRYNVVHGRGGCFCDGRLTDGDVAGIRSRWRRWRRDYSNSRHNHPA